MHAAARSDADSAQASWSDACHHPTNQGSMIAPSGTTKRAALPHRDGDSANAPTRPSGAPVTSAATNHEVFEPKEPGMRPVSSPTP